ncbi:DNA-binding transcriptional MocR family regulator [Rhizobium sp. BK251]|nr:DNA-binding transcriptional MocR family regulator [Rhizobium sp. BK251]
MTEGGAAGTTRVAMVMTTIRQRIAGRSLTPGAKLPSVRALAATLKVSTSTVVDAYERLVAEGAILSRPGSGFYVANQTAPFSLSEAGPRLDRAVDPFWVSRQSLEAGDGGLKPGCGWLPASWLPEEGIRRALRSLSRLGMPALAEYGSPLGLPPLRQLIARRAAERGIEASPDQVMLTESGTQAIDLLCRLFLEPGDTVLVDDPCYFNFHALLRAHRARIVSVPYTQSGPDIEAFAQTVAEHRPRLYITNSAIHNPTGAVLSPVTAHRVLKLADQFDLTIIEDDIFADFEYTHAPRLAAFDGLDRVIHIGSFSKTLSASARCGFVVARPEWIEGLTDLKIATSFGGGPLMAELVLNVLSDGSHRKHVEGLRSRLSETMAHVSARLKSIGFTPWLEPQAGMFLWCRLPDGIDAADVAHAALERNVVLAPGNAFSLSQSATSFMRFNVSQTLDPRIFDVLALAMRAAGKVGESRGEEASIEPPLR